MYTITHYSHTRKARTASGAIKAAQKLVKLYGRGNKNPVIDAGTDAEAKDLVNTQMVAQTNYCVRVAGEAVC